MIRHTPRVPNVALPLPTAETADDPAFAFRWLFEKTMVWNRWLTILLFYVLAISFRASDSLLEAILIGASIAAGNTGVMVLLRRRAGPSGLRAVSGIATLLEWSGVLAILSLCVGNPFNNALSVLLILILVGGIRYGRAGLILSTFGAELIVIGFAGVHLIVLQSLRIEILTRGVAAWTGSILLTSLLVGCVIRAGEIWLQQTAEQWKIGRATLHWLCSGLSPREWELLPLLARTDLTYEQIAEALSISSETVKTHVRNLGIKLGANGRKAVVAAARERGLLLDLKTDSSGH